MSKIKRLHSIYDFPDYHEYADKFDDQYPSWFTSHLAILDANKQCRYCGKPIPAMREHFCSDICNKYFKYADHDTKVNSLRRFIHRYYKFECRGCQAKLAYVVPSGLILPIYSGEVDHIKPLKDGGEHFISNLQLLCMNCHMEKTVRQRRLTINK